MMNITVYRLYHADTKCHYIGSTTLKLKTRLANHKATARKGLNTSPLYEKMREVGIDGWRIQMLESAVVDGRSEQNQLEDKHYLELRDEFCLNKNRPCRTQERHRAEQRMYYQAHRADRREYYQQRKHIVAQQYKENRIQRINKQKAYYESHKEKARAYYRANKERLLQYQKQYSAQTERRVQHKCIYCSRDVQNLDKHNDTVMHIRRFIAY
jgi:hypothetical protein